MNRLQVGGLALIVGFSNKGQNLGKVVKLDCFVGETLCKNPNGYGKSDSAWLVSSDDLIGFNGEKIKQVLVESKHLMPLGDKQTQDELAKEKELEYTR